MRSEPIPMEWTKRVYTRMADAYGQQFLSRFRTEDDVRSWHETWGQGLAGLTAEQVAHGVRSMLTRDSAFPPACGEFRTLCAALSVRPKSVAEEQGPVTPPSEDQRACLRALVAARQAQHWRWTPDKVVNETQAKHVYEAYRRGYSPGVAFFHQCVAAGVMSEGGSLVRRQEISKVSQ